MKRLYCVWDQRDNLARLAHKDITSLVEARSICREELQVGKMRRVYDGEGIARYAPMNKGDDRRVWIEIDNY